MKTGYFYENQYVHLQSNELHARKTKKKQLIYGVFAGVLLIVIMNVLKSFIESMEDLSIFASLGAGAMMMIIIWIVAFSTYRREMIHYEGTVHKTKEKKKVSRQDAEDVTGKERYKYYLYIKKSRGGRMKHMLLESRMVSDKGRMLLDYYEGASVKKYRAVDLPEKYDRREDTFKLCIFCGTTNELEHLSCANCAKPLAE